MKWFCAVIVTAALSIAGLTASQQSRDVAPAPQPGTAVLGGVVMVDGPDSRPARGAIVTLNHADRLHGDTAVTDEQGRFEFRGVPAGRYLLAAEKQSYIRTSYGATRPGRAGTPIAISEGQRLSDVILRLVRGAAITGIVRDVDGEPAPGVSVAVTRLSSSGKPRMEEANGDGDSTTDDRGVYRRYGLAPGQYLIEAQPSSFGHGPYASGANLTTAANVSWARAMLSVPTGADSRSTPPPAPTAYVSYAPIYYPNTLQRSAAAPISLAAGEERRGVDFTLQLIPTYRVSGIVRAADGSTPTKAPRVFLAELDKGSGWHAVKESEGARFSFDGLAPGAYAAAAIEDGSKTWAIVNVTVGNQDQTLALTLQPGLEASGRLVFQGSQPAPPDLTHIEIFLGAVVVAGGVVVEPASVSAKADGTFVLDGLVPGSYRLSAGLSGVEPKPGAGWTMRSAMVGNQDIADVPLEIRGGSDIGKIVVTFTDRHTELSGRLQDASGRAASDYFIIVFPAEERTWFPGSRRIAQTRPASDGHFIFRDLPPGDYLIAALTDVEPDEWFDTGFLRDLVAASIKITLGEGEKKVQDIKIK